MTQSCLGTELLRHSGVAFACGSRHSRRGGARKSAVNSVAAPARVAAASIGAERAGPAAGDIGRIRHASSPVILSLQTTFGIRAARHKIDKSQPWCGRS